MANSPLFHRAHYNIIAARIRESFAANMDNVHDSDVTRLHLMTVRGVIADMAIEFAKTFQKDSPFNFDPIKFLEACSPDNDLYPLAELWIQDPNYP